MEGGKGSEPHAEAGRSPLSLLQDWRVSLLEAALATLAELGSIAGSFLARRFGQEAWPALQRLLREGPPGQRIIAPGLWPRVCHPM